MNKILLSLSFLLIIAVALSGCVVNVGNLDEKILEASLVKEFKSYFPEAEFEKDMWMGSELEERSEDIARLCGDREIDMNTYYYYFSLTDENNKIEGLVTGSAEVVCITDFDFEDEKETETNNVDDLEEVEDDTSYEQEEGKGEEELVCAQDVKECPNGEYMSRNPENNCEFDPCPETNDEDDSKDDNDLEDDDVYENFEYVRDVSITFSDHLGENILMPIGVKVLDNSGDLLKRATIYNSKLDVSLPDNACYTLEFYGENNYIYQSEDYANQDNRRPDYYVEPNQNLEVCLYGSDYFGEIQLDKVYNLKSSYRFNSIENGFRDFSEDFYLESDLGYISCDNYSQNFDTKGKSIFIFDESNGEWPHGDCYISIRNDLEFVTDNFYKTYNYTYSVRGNLPVSSSENGFDNYLVKSGSADAYYNNPPYADVAFSFEDKYYIEPIEEEQYGPLTPVISIVIKDDITRDYLGGQILYYREDGTEQSITIEDGDVAWFYVGLGKEYSFKVYRYDQILEEFSITPIYGINGKEIMVSQD